MKNKVKTFEQALSLAGTTKEKKFFASKRAMAQFESDELAYKKLKVVVRALNTDPETKKVWEPNYTDGSWKYWPWFGIKATKRNPAGVGFSGTGYGGWYSYSDVGSRLCFPTSELALYAGKQFKDLYKDFILIKK